MTDQDLLDLDKALGWFPEAKGAECGTVDFRHGVVLAHHYRALESKLAAAQMERDIWCRQVKTEMRIQGELRADNARLREALAVASMHMTHEMTGWMMVQQALAPSAGGDR